MSTDVKGFKNDVIVTTANDEAVHLPFDVMAKIVAATQRKNARAAQRMGA